jgi:hypothetical protein
MRTGWLIALLIVSICSVCAERRQEQTARRASTQVATAQAVRSDSDADAVLSVVIPASVTDAYGKWRSFNTYKQYLLAKEPSNRHLERECVSVPKEKRESYESLFADYQNLQQHPVSVAPHLSLDKPYRVLTQEDVQRVQSCSQGVRSACEDQFSFAPGIVYLSNIAFNADRSLALVWVYNWCGGLCGKGAWHVLAKTDGRWVEEHVVRCVGWS